MIRRAVLVVSILFTALAAYAFLVEPNRLVVREITIPSDRLARFFEGAVVVHISDTHVAKIGGREQRLLELLHRIDPDYVFVTGDYVRGDKPFGPAVELLGRIPAKKGFFGVLGNVDYNGTRESCRLCHSTGPAGELRGDDPVVMMRNNTRVLERNGRELVLLGLDEIAAQNGPDDPKRLLFESSDDRPRIVIAHTSSLIDEAADAGIDLYLAGDTHGGQVALPEWILKKMMPEKRWKYRDGLFRVGPTWLYVHRGIGWSILPVRFGYPPMVTVLRFEEVR